MKETQKHTEIQPIWTFPLYYQFYIETTEPYHLRISDIMKLNTGDKLSLTMFDRNVWDLTIDNTVVRNKGYTATQFFAKAQQAVYTHTKDLQGHIDFVDGNTNDAFEWDLEYTSRKWFPLKNGCIKGHEYWHIDKEHEKPWKQFSVNTRLGWHGPCVPTQRLQCMPDIFYVDDDTIAKGIQCQLQAS